MKPTNKKKDKTAPNEPEMPKQKPAPVAESTLSVMGILRSEVFFDWFADFLMLFYAVLYIFHAMVAMPGQRNMDVYEAFPLMILMLFAHRAYHAPHVASYWWNIIWCIIFVGTEIRQCATMISHKALSFNCMDLDWRRFIVFAYDIWMIFICFVCVIWMALLGYRLFVKWLSLQDKTD